MSRLMLESYLPAELSPVGATRGNRREDPITESVEHALSAAHPDRRGVEHRREQRYPYPHPIHLTPLDTPRGVRAETIVVIGKQLSPHGVDFYHREPLGHRRVIASLDAGERGWIGFLLELAWCRFNRHGWYDNGGRFLAIVDSPLEIERRTSA
ncbi:MAG: hypothetical protein WD872_16980 [Pirellulaceae bacterium]